MINSLVIHNLPEIVIARNRFLEPIFTAYIQSRAEWKEWIPPTKKDIEQRVKDYRVEWGKYEKQILDGMCQLLGLHFKQNIIYVHIVAGNPRSFSHPIVIKSGYPPQEFVIVLTHELIHNLLRESGIPVAIYKKLYPDETRTAGVHAIVHAVLQYVYLEILHEGIGLKKYITQSQKARDKGYARSWEIIEREGYREIIARFKEEMAANIS